MTKNRQNNCDVFVFRAVFVGLLLELFNKAVLSPSTEYFTYYSISTQLRGAFMVFIFYSAYKASQVGGSWLLFLLATFNFAAILMNVAYLGGRGPHEAIHGLRSEYFSPAYRAVECLIILRTGRHGIPDILMLICDRVLRPLYVGFLRKVRFAKKKKPAVHRQ